MLLTVSDIPDEGLHQELDLPVNTGGDAAPDIARASLSIFRLGRKVLIEGSVKVSLTLSCSRCLKEFSLPLDFDFREEYNPAEDMEAGGEKELQGRELDLGFYSGDEINIDEVVGEQVLLSVPMSPLCTDECRGICPTCGKDLNEGPCECRKEEPDPRLAPLQKLKDAFKEGRSS